MPGAIATERQKEILMPTYEAHVLSKLSKRLLQPDEVARLVLCLLQSPIEIRTG